MNLGSFPTDSLYKFAALVGIAVVLFAVYFEFNMKTALESDVVELGRKLAVLQAEIDNTKEEVDWLDKLLNDLDNNANLEIGIGESSHKLYFSNADMKTVFFRNRDMAGELAVRHAELSYLSNWYTLLMG